MDRLLQKDLVLKVLSLILAIYLWTLVTSTQNPIIARSFSHIPIAITGVPQGEVAQISPSYIDQLTVKGPSSILANLSAASFQGRVDLSRVSLGTGTATVEVSSPSGVVPIARTPQNVSVRVFAVVNVDRPVTAVPVGTPSLGYQVGTLTPAQTTVAVAGPSNRVELVDRVEAQVVVTGASSSLARYADLVAVDSAGHPVTGVQVLTPRLLVTVRVVPFNQRVVPVEVGLSGFPASGYHIGPIVVTPPAVAVRGSVASLSRLQRLMTEPVPVGGKSGTIRARVPVILPKGILPAGSETVDVQIDIVPGGVTSSPSHP